MLTHDTATIEQAIDNFSRIGMQIAAATDPDEDVVLHCDRDAIFEICMMLQQILRNRPKAS